MNPIDTSSLDQYKQAATSASNDTANQTAAAPQLLNQLKQNLTTIFAKNNPFIAERGTALENYLNAPSQSRVSTLPGNLPNVEGSNLNLSPTQQDAVTTSRSNAALVPLLGLNQIVTGLYGNIPGMVQGAGDIYNSQIQASQLRSQQAQQGLAQAMQELQMQEQARQFNVSEANKKSSAGTPASFFGDLIAAMGMNGMNQQPQNQGLPPLDGLIEPDQGKSQQSPSKGNVNLPALAGQTFGNVVTGGNPILSNTLNYLGPKAMNSVMPFLQSAGKGIGNFANNIGLKFGL
jgi:hypothetical protein